MNVKQIYEIVNTTTKEALGESVVVNEDLSNIVDVGEAIFNANAFENYTKVLVDHIGKVVFVAREYKGKFPSVMMDSWEFGSVKEKIRMKMPAATENADWKLEDGETYDTNQFTAPSISVKFFNSLTTYQVKMSITELQLKSAFSSIGQLNSFLSMIYTNINNSIKIKNDEMVRRTINNFIGETFYDFDDSGTYTGKSGVRAINLLYKYNNTYGLALTKEAAIADKDFLRYASAQIRLYIKHLANASVLFNIGKTEKFTTSEYLHCILHSEFATNASTYLYSDTWHKEDVVLPNYEETDYWQGSGSSYNFEDTSSIDVKTSAGHTVKASGILGVLFDREALGVCNENQRVATHYVASAEFVNEWHKVDCNYFNDLDENFIVFYIA